MIVKKEKDEFQNYLKDASNFSGSCDSVYFPENISAIAELVKKANVKKNLLTVSGNGTGLTGARVPQSGIVLATDKLNKIIEINRSEKYAIVQPGILLSDFQKEIDANDLFYPPDPTEQECFIGGTVATNASGAKTFKYGSTRKFVEELSVVLPSGETLHLKRGVQKADGHNLKLLTESGQEIKISIPEIKMPNVKNASGYFCKPGMDAVDLFIGSEGTLGVIAEIKLKLLDKPQNILSGVIFFPKEFDGLKFIAEARRISFSNIENEKAVIDALGLEFFDANSLEFLEEDFPNIPKNTGCAVWFEQELTSDNELELTNRWIELIEKFNGDLENSWIAQTAKDREQFHDFRHAVSWKVNEYIASKNLTKVGTDVAVPDDKFIDFYFDVKNLVTNSNLNFLSYGHFGNSHLHLNMLPENDSEHLKAKNIYRKICELSVKLGGTISAEHGIGKLKKEYLLMMYGEETIRKMANLKKQFDPNLILGIGNLFEPKFFG